MKNTSLIQAAIVCTMIALFVGCATGPSEEELAQQAAAEQLNSIRESYQSLTQLRADIAAAEAQLEEIEAISERQRSDEQKQAAEELPAKIEEMAAQRDEAYDNVQAQLAEFLNTALNEFPESADTQEALKIYADEAILVADDMVEKAGDYAKAMNHLQGAASYYEAVGLPVYEPLTTRLAELDDWRFVTEERFQGLKKNMTEEEVKATIGVPYYGNIQTDEGRGVETWLYKKREGGAAAVYFKIKSGKVYSMKWDAVKTKVAE